MADSVGKNVAGHENVRGKGRRTVHGVLSTFMHGVTMPRDDKSGHRRSSIRHSGKKKTKQKTKHNKQKKKITICSLLKTTILEREVEIHCDSTMIIIIIMIIRNFMVCCFIIERDEII